MKIPKILHHISPGGEQLIPKPYNEWYNSWKEKLPGWKFIVWNTQMIDTLIKKGFPQYEELYNSLPTFLDRKHMARLMILYVFGGVYVGVETKCIKNIEELFEPETELAFVEFHDSKSAFNMECFIQSGFKFKSGPYLFNNFLASVPRHLFWKSALNNFRKYVI